MQTAFENYERCELNHNSGCADSVKAEYGAVKEYSPAKV